MVFRRNVRTTEGLKLEIFRVFPSFHNYHKGKREHILDSSLGVLDSTTWWPISHSGELWPCDPNLIFYSTVEESLKRWRRLTCDRYTNSISPKRTGKQRERSNRERDFMSFSVSTWAHTHVIMSYSTPFGLLSTQVSPSPPGFRYGTCNDEDSLGGDCPHPRPQVCTYALPFS